jgi:hypothetical protein
MENIVYSGYVDNSWSGPCPYETKDKSVVLYMARLKRMPNTALNGSCISSQIHLNANNFAMTGFIYPMYLNMLV